MTHMTHLTPGELSVTGGRAAILTLIADDAMRARDWDQALDCFNQARELTALLAHSRGRMHYIDLNLARIDYRKGNYRDALNALQNLVCDIDWLMPSDIEIMADCCEKLGDNAKALVLRQAAIDARNELDAL